MASKVSSPLVVSTVSVVVLALVSSCTLYLYFSYARPEAIAPGAYEQEIFARIENINKAVTGLKGSYKWDPFFSVPASSSIKTSLEIEQQALKKSPVAEYFEDLYKRVTELSTAQAGNDGINEKDKKIEEIKFFPKSITLDHELKTETVPEEPTDKVLIKQVGLSLGTAKTHSSVHRIQNLFGSPGLVGHLYIAESRSSDWDKRSLMKVDSLDFSTSDKFSQSLHSTGLFVSNLIFLNQKNQYIYVNGPSFNEEYIKHAVEPEEVELNSNTIDFVNPYKWLYLATKTEFSKVLEQGKPIVVLVFPYKTGSGDKVVEVSKTTKYPKDVNLFPVKSLPNWDVNIFEADEQRIVNHSKTMLTAFDVGFFDGL